MSREKPDPLETHHMEQGMAAMRDFAGRMHAYYLALHAEGFTPAQAFTLTVNYQNELLRGMTGPKE